MDPKKLKSLSCPLNFRMVSSAPISQTAVMDNNGTTYHKMKKRL